MAPEDGAKSMSRNTTAGAGGPRMSGGQVLKKGPWTAAEDAVLMEYVKKHGEGNWNAVQRNSGLMRCGKSCRLRWANHLRPNLKKGAFTPEEERQIIELHSKFGNKWARMALHLQGRTDNEIKNYWNTRLKRRLRAGLPIYPVDFQQHHRRHQEQQSLQNQTIPFSSSSSSSNHVNNNNGLNSISQMLFDPMNYPVINTAPFYLQNSQSHFKIGHSNNQIVNKNNSFFNQAFPSSLQSNHAIMQIPKTEPSYNDAKLFENVENDLPSIQSSFQVITPTCSSNTVNDHLIVPSNDGDNAISPYICPRENSTGLLEDVLGESRALINSQILSNESKSSESDKGKETITHDDYSLMKEPENVTLESVFEPTDPSKTPIEDSSSGHSSIEVGVNPENDTFDEMNVTDDDFSSWLDFPTGSLQDWYGGSEDASNDQKQAVDVLNENTPVGGDNQVEIACSPDATAETDQDHDHDHDQDHDHDWTMGSCCWNNMPGFS